MIATSEMPLSLPSSAAALEIARLLESLAENARRLGLGGLAESIAAVGLEAGEEARHIGRLKM